MNCYRNCNEECDDLKKKYCIFKINKRQYELIKIIRELDTCPRCGEFLIRAKYKDKEINLCTSCGNGLEAKYIKGMKAC